MKKLVLVLHKYFLEFCPNFKYKCFQQFSMAVTVTSWCFSSCITLCNITIKLFKPFPTIRYFCSTLSSFLIISFLLSMIYKLPSLVTISFSFLLKTTLPCHHFVLFSILFSSFFTCLFGFCRHNIIFHRLIVYEETIRNHVFITLFFL